MMEFVPGILQKKIIQVGKPKIFQSNSIFMKVLREFIAVKTRAIYGSNENLMFYLMCKFFNPYLLIGSWKEHMA